MKRIVLALSTLALLAPAAAQAAEPVMIVRYGDLNLSSDAGAGAALRRIRDAADRYCGGQGERGHWRQLTVNLCRDEMVGKAVDRLGAPRVTAMHHGAAAIQVARR